MILLSCYLKRFSGAALSAGLPFKVTSDIFNINDIVANGTDRNSEALSKDFAGCSKNSNSFKNKKLLFFHGDQDRRVSIKHFESIKQQILSGYDLLDDGIINDSLIHKEVSFLAQEDKKYDTSVEEYYLESKSFLKFYFIHGLAHEWSGGPFKIERNDPHGPDMAKIILRNFL